MSKHSPCYTSKLQRSGAGDTDLGSARCHGALVPSQGQLSRDQSWSRRLCGCGREHHRRPHLHPQQQGASEFGAGANQRDSGHSCPSRLPGLLSGDGGRNLSCVIHQPSSQCDGGFLMSIGSAHKQSSTAASPAINITFVGCLICCSSRSRSREPA